MGSFVGHIDEATFFLLLSLWWMWNTFSAHIRSQWNKTEYRTRLSYPLPCKRFVPLEAILKTAFPIAGFMGEVITNGVALIDEEGNFRKLKNLQHMSIYAMFIVHGVIDIMMSYRVPLPKGMDYFSAMFAFGWYGVSFTFHAHMHGKEEMETIIHILPVYVIAALVVAGIAELFKPTIFIITMIRIYCVMILGTWFTHVAFMLYLPYPWPGATPNPKYDQSDPRNVNFVVAAFGFHLIMNLCFITVAYLIIYAILRIKGEGRCQFKPLLEKSEEEI